MNLKKIIGIFSIGILLFSCKSNNNPTQRSIQSIGRIFPKGEIIMNTNFTGKAYLQMLVSIDSLNQTTVGNVTFEPKARTKWHFHPAGQILLVTDGVGYYQEKGQPKKILKKGDVIKCLPNVEHWHGASVNSHFVQVAITNNEKGSVIWLAPVTEEEYNY